jgi:hypothetical protein
MLIPLLAAIWLSASPSPAPQTVFACTAGPKRVTIVQRGDQLEYSFGKQGRPEITLSGGSDGGVFYHRTLYSRGEDQTLRFVSGEWTYVLFNRWQAPQELSSGRVQPEYNASGVLVMDGGKLVRRINCNKGSGNMTEWPIFKQLKQDEENLTPDDA